eukprot:1189751-Prorocentrum_minimum.AAC.1
MFTIVVERLGVGRVAGVCVAAGGNVLRDRLGQQQHLLRVALLRRVRGVRRRRQQLRQHRQALRAARQRLRFPGSRRRRALPEAGAEPRSGPEPSAHLADDDQRGVRPAGGAGQPGFPSGPSEPIRRRHGAPAPADGRYRSGRRRGDEGGTARLPGGSDGANSPTCQHQPSAYMAWPIVAARPKRVLTAPPVPVTARVRAQRDTPATRHRAPRNPGERVQQRAAERVRERDVRIRGDVPQRDGNGQRLVLRGGLPAGADALPDGHERKPNGPVLRPRCGPEKVVFSLPLRDWCPLR